MLEKYHKPQQKPNTIDKLKVVQQTIWEEVPKNTSTRRCLADFTKRLTAFTAANGGHFELVQ